MKTFIIGLFLVLSMSSYAQLNIVTTTTNLADIAKKIGGESVNVHSLAKGTQDPHFLEAKPSYTFKIARADLLISIGAGLEVGWLPLVVRGGRNPKLRIGQAGRLEAYTLVSLTDEVKGKLTRAHGDVHPEGNPHFMLSPSKALLVAQGVRDRLIQLDSENKKKYESNYKAYEKRTQETIRALRAKIQKGTKIITYHRTLTYFLDEFGIHVQNVLEPKPGIPPTASHIIAVIKEMKKEGIRHILVENYFDDSVAKRIRTTIKDVKIRNVPVAVDGSPEARDLFSLYNILAKALED
ncbi:metal ABC transporter substrate-binding protein [Halobacteriovorax sp. ZH4_bin.1]|uniref:metal ABC transporter substrate-binding protein n=1 Tax=unclassified Halobacteriovorax TaxID=2639665 RepID=UPI003710F84F